jgi:hypothetical protein
MSEAFKQRLQDLQNMQQGISPSGTTDTVYLSNIGGRYSTQPGIFDVGGRGNAIKFYSLSDEEKAKAIQDINQEAETKRKLSFLPFFNTETARINPGLISQQNTNSTTQSTNTGTNQVDNQVQQTNDTNPQNIFGERLAQAFFPGMPQSNKNLINAAILRGSLELLKPRQPGENLASQLGRGLEAGTQFGKDIQKRQLEALATQASLLKAQQGKMPSQVTITENKLDSFKDLANVLRKTSPTFEKNLGSIQSKIGDMFGPEADTLKAIATEAIGRQSANPRLTPEQALEEAAVSILGGNISSMSVSQTEPTEDQYSKVNR